MAMTKKEKAQMEGLLEMLALRFSAAKPAQLTQAQIRGMPPDRMIWFFAGAGIDLFVKAESVKEAKASESRLSRWKYYSSQAEALQAARIQIEHQAARKLRAIDTMIEKLNACEATIPE